MRISTLLKISVAVAMLMVVGLAVTNWFTATKLALLSAKQDQAQTAARDIANLLVLTHEYAIYSGERAAQQWRLRHATIIKNLEAEVKDVVPAPPEAIKDAAVLSELFQQLVGSTSNRPAIQSYQKQLLLDQMQNRSQALAESIHRWSNAIAEERHKSEQTFFFLTISIPIMMSLILALLAFILHKRVLSPLKRLLQAVRAVMNGDLSVRSATGTDDELGEVSHAFDAMAIDMVSDLKQRIAERKQISESLRESDERFTVAFNNAPIIIAFSTIDDGAYLDVNRQFLDVSGFSRDEVIGKTSVELDFISQSDWMLLIEEIKQNGNIHDHELMLRSKSGQKRLCKYWGEIVSVAGVNRLLSIALDITDHRRVEQQLQQSQKMESIGNLAGGVAHDFNNMLSVILGHAELALIGMDSTKPLYNHLAVIRSTAERSADLTRQLLAFASKQTIAPKVLNLNGAVSNMLRMLHRLIGENIDLAWQPATDLWQIKFDLSQIDQIMANLCVNARDAITGTGRIIIETRNISIDEQFCANRTDALPGEYVQLIVSDNGIGMDEATLDRIFEPFFTTKETGKGTGLGLATVFGIVRQHNGFITVNSKPGVGTTFTIYLPRYADETGYAVNQDVKMPPPCGREVILLVEDELEILNVTAMILAKQGYTVHQADTPAKAISLAEDHAGEISLLVTDVIMPGMSGKELAGILKSKSLQLKCLFMSGYTADIIGHHGVLDEDVHFIQKPFTFPELSVKVREVLDS